MVHPKVAVEVLTYNSDFEKLKKTLNSIIIQKNIAFEIIIADDGSKDNNFEKIENFFSEKNFKNYKLVGNLKNQGTVKNVISGLEKTSAEYVKDIAPGDFFYDENTLACFMSEIENSKADVYFGNPCYYTQNDEKLSFFNPKIPSDLNAYKTKNVKKIKQNYLNKRDYILGADFIVRTSTFLKYLKKIENKVIYAEDCSFIYMIADNIIPVYINQNFIWYEFGAGISTSKNNSWIKKIEEDNKATFKLLFDEKLISNTCYEMKYSKSFIKKLALRLFLNPESLIQKICPRKIVEIERTDCEILKSLLEI